MFSRHTIFSPKDGQPCMDHDRQSGEVHVIDFVHLHCEYVAIFMEKLWNVNIEEMCVI